MTTSKMSPSKNPIPFAGAAILSAPVIQRVDRGIRDLAVNYDLKNRLAWLSIHGPNARGETNWTFSLYVLAEPMAANTTVVDLIASGDLPKPIVTLTNRSIGGMNKFLSQCGSAIAKKYGQTAATNQRKTA